jgi:ribonucleoside-diphosphate reductase alpha chain
MSYQIIPSEEQKVDVQSPIGSNVSLLDILEDEKPFQGHKVLRRNNNITDFDVKKIAIAIDKAFLATKATAAHSQSIKKLISQLTLEIAEVVTRRVAAGVPIHIEDIQDQVELALMRSEEREVARNFVLYRERRAMERSSKQTPLEHQEKLDFMVLHPDGSSRKIDVKELSAIIEEACAGLEFVNKEKILEETIKNIYPNIPVGELTTTMIMATRPLVEQEPSYTYVCARLLLGSLRSTALSEVLKQQGWTSAEQMKDIYSDYFSVYIDKGIEYELLDPRLKSDFDLQALGQALKAERDFQFTFLGFQTLYDRYFLHKNDRRIEMPQAFFMRVAMGLAINEKDKTQRAIEFYNALSSFDFMSSTPTLFNSGTLRPQLSSCYLTTIGDNLDNIYESLKDNALLSKFAGGLGNDWTQVRALGSYIKGTNGKSQGVVPFLKVANDTALAVNQGGKRKGALCSYLETWHMDIEDFLEMRKNTGDERRRAHDMNTANWIPDLFMKRVVNEESWTLFSPDEVPDLHDLYGEDFEKRYVEYEALAETKEIRSRSVKALDLWRKMLGMLFETGHPWITFKDPCNIRSPQQHVGVVHSSNLCTEITLNTNDKEIAVCNLGSINLVKHINEQGKLDLEKLERTVTTGMRMLDNVIDYNYYSVEKAAYSNHLHRPIGFGLMGFHDALYKLSIPYASEKAVEFADRSMEAISYFVIKASTDLAEEKGVYESYKGSLWSQGILPIDSVKLLEQQRAGLLKQNTEQSLDWSNLRERVKTVGMRNSNTMAIAPTATIANIVGVSPGIEPSYQNLYTKTNLSGDFLTVNAYLVDELKRLELWDEAMINDLKYYKGSVQSVDRVPQHIKALFSTAFEVSSEWLIEAASRRQKWLDQSQSLNIFIANPDGKKLDNIYKTAWLKGLKTTYYLRSLAASDVSSVDGKGSSNSNSAVKLEGHLNGSNSLNGSTSETNGNANGSMVTNVCSLLDPDCEACQ